MSCFTPRCNRVTVVQQCANTLWQYRCPATTQPLAQRSMNEICCAHVRYQHELVLRVARAEKTDRNKYGFATTNDGASFTTAPEANCPIARLKRLNMEAVADNLKAVGNQRRGRSYAAPQHTGHRLRIFITLMNYSTANVNYTTLDCCTYTPATNERRTR